MWLAADEVNACPTPSDLESCSSRGRCCSGPDDDETWSWRVSSKVSERSDGVVHSLFGVQAANRHENRSVRQAELVDLRPGPRLEQGCVNAIGDNVTESSFEQGVASRVLELLPRRNHPHTRAEPVPVTVLEPFSEEPDEPLSFAHLGPRVPSTSSGQSGPSKSYAVAVKLRD